MTAFKNRHNPRSGVVLPSVLALILCGCVIISMFAVHAGRSMMLTRRALQYQRACVLSESGLGFGIMSVRARISEIGWQKFSERFAVGSIERLDATKLPDYDGEYKNGVYFTVVSNNTSSATVDEGRIYVEVYAISQHKDSEIASAVRENVSIAFSSLGKYAAFYTRDLEVWPGENMTFVGKVHTNGDLYLGADKLLTFERNVTAHGKFYAMRKPNSGYGDTAYVTATDRVKFRKGDDADYADGNKNTSLVDVIRKNAQGTTRMDTLGLGNSWGSESASYYAGAVKTDQMKLAPPISVNDDEHTIIERVKKSDDPTYNQDTEAVKFANKAALTIRIDAEGGLHLYSGKYINGSDANEIPNPERLMQPAASISKPNDSANGNYNVVQSACTYTDDAGEQQTTDPLPAYQVNNAIYDRRDDRAKAIVDIYVDQILNNATLRNYLYPDTSASGSGDDSSATTDDREPGVLYVTRDEPIGYPKIHTEQRGTGQYTQSTDTRTTTSATEKNNLVNQGYTVVSTTTTTKYYIRSGWNWVETDKATYNRTSSRNRKTETVTTYVLSKTTQTEIMETVAVTNYIPVEPAVRLRNASDLRLAKSDGRPGLSIATDLPMYVEGSFNTNGEKGHPNDNCTDKAAALVAADAVTMLSTNWKDEWRVPKWDGWNGSNPTSLRPTENLNTRSAVETTFNGVLMTGIVESNGGTYSGGLQNLFRFHENWRPSSTLPYNFNGSMVCMWTSHIANNPIEGTYTYQPPSRPWGWAQMNPPGLPNLMDIQESNWERIDISQYGDSAFFNN